MPVKLRLQRKGRTKAPFYHIVAADSRAPRDGKFIEKIGTYNPLTVPATIELDRVRAYYWVDNGAQPTDTVNAILRFKGILYQKHLMRGVRKGAMTQEQAEVLLTKWIDSKEGKVEARKIETIRKKEEHVKLVDGKPKARPVKVVEAPVVEFTEDVIESVVVVETPVVVETIAAPVVEVIAAPVVIETPVVVEVIAAPVVIDEVTSPVVEEVVVSNIIETSENIEVTTSPIHVIEETTHTVVAEIVEPEPVVITTTTLDAEPTITHSTTTTVLDFVSDKSDLTITTDNTVIGDEINIDVTKVTSTTTRIVGGSTNYGPTVVSQGVTTKSIEVDIDDSASFEEVQAIVTSIGKIADEADATTEA
jgi:small subunit ribosomal protein S16